MSKHRGYIDECELAWQAARDLTIGRLPSRKKARVIGFAYASQLLDYDISGYDPYRSSRRRSNRVIMFFSEFSLALYSSGHSARFVRKMSDSLFSGLENNAKEELLRPSVHDMYFGVSDGLMRAGFTR